ncbi:MAG: carbon monoxide dehydrogenase subunit G [Nitrososphaerota archaeon]|jgi:carbon monoxide dehydrogenase subunit G|nr:carbon monoxide dehydrogenase subunit G [Nitrososphaerota archaeon]
MHFEGVFEVKAPKEKVFWILMDPNQISQCMPDLQNLDVKSPDDYTVVVRAGVSFIKGDFTLHFNVAEKSPPTHAKLNAHGTGIGSSVDMETTMDIADAQEGGSSMKWAADAKVGGRIASLGQRMLESQAEKIIRQLFDCMQHKLESV